MPGWTRIAKLWEKLDSEHREKMSQPQMIDPDKVEQMIRDLRAHMQWAQRAALSGTFAAHEVMLTAERATVSIEALKRFKEHLQQAWT